MSFAIHHETAAPLALRSAILLYGPKHGGSAYATVHDVGLGPDNTPVIRAGRAMSRDALAQVVNDLGKTTRRRHGLLPPNVLALGAELAMWWLPPGERTFYFQSNEKGGIGHRTGKGFHPGLVFVAGGTSMWVFAVKGSERPSEQTHLCHAPMMNIYEDGRLCTGSMPLPNDALAECLPAWTESFFKSAFTHPNQTKALRYKGGLHAFWRDMLDGKFASFPEQVLLPFKDATVGSLAEQVEGSR
jgi:hypothetical protein